MTDSDSKPLLVKVETSSSAPDVIVFKQAINKFCHSLNVIIQNFLETAGGPSCVLYQSLDFHFPDQNYTFRQYAGKPDFSNDGPTEINISSKLDFSEAELHPGLYENVYLFTVLFSDWVSTLQK